MRYTRLLPSLCRIAQCSLLFGIVAVAPAFGQANKPAKAVGQIILYMQPGTAAADVQALANKVSPAGFRALDLKDVYVIDLPAARKTDADTATAVAQLQADVRVKWVGATPLKYITQVSTAPKLEPNDPRYKSGEEWGHKMINMPQAWALQQGAAGITLGWIDSGFDPAHEDAKGQFSDGSYDEADNDSDITADGSGASGEFDHGTGTSGVAFANTNNNLGIAGVCWKGIKCVALKIQKKGQANLDSTAIYNSYAYIMANYKKYNIVALNMSYGGTFPDPVEQAALQQISDAGVITVASSGNSGDAGNPNIYPADFPSVIAVSAVNNQGKLTYYSSYGKVEIAAPGGEQFSADDPGGDLVLINDTTKKYAFEQGTSFSAPYVTAVLGLLRSVPGVTPALAKDALLKGANHTGLGALPDSKYGYGILDAYASLARVSVQATVTSPDGLNSSGQSSDPANVVPPPVETFKPVVSFHIGNVTCDNVTFTIDSSIPSLAKSFTLTQLISGSLPAGISEFSINGACTGVSSPQYDVTFRVAFPSTGYFQHTVQVSATDPNSGITASDTRIFTITPHTIPAGLSMLSIPYYEAPTDAPAPYTGTFRDVAQLLGPTATLYRYLLPAEVGTQNGKVVNSAYAAYNASDPAANINATFRPRSAVPTVTGPLGSQIDARPLGIGYFINTPNAITVVNNGLSYTTGLARIPLHEGWNLVGDPFPYSVPFNSTQVETTNGTRLTIGAAVDQKLMLPYIYKFTNGDYDFSVLPSGSLEVWQAHWLYVLPRDPANVNPATVLTLIVTPTPLSNTGGRSVARTTSSTPTRSVSGPGSWLLRLQAHVGDKSDANNYVGMSPSATDGNDLTKVPKPPKPDSTVQMYIQRANSPAGAYAQDIRATGGVKQWDLVVSTDKQNANVSLEWPDAHSLPRTYSLILTDQVTGRSLDLRNSSSYSFNSGATPGTRSFTLVARPTASISARPVFNNIVVNPGRSGGRAQNTYNISYNLSTQANVSVSILTTGGHPVAQLATRAVTSGDNSLTWNGLDNQGRSIAAGSYVLQFQAVTNDGLTTRAIRPLILSGR